MPAASILAAAMVLSSPTASAETIPAGAAGYQSHVNPFFARYCVACHGPDTSKGQLRLDRLDGELGAADDVDRWELVLEMLESGEMPPEDQTQPTDEQRRAVASWVEAALQSYSAGPNPDEAPATARRLTNFEYQNTMRDLLGFELNLADNLPEDPTRPYEFNNTAEFMLIGPEQMDRYRENARRAMASAIVDRAPPQVHRTERTWKPLDPPHRGMQYDEVGIYGNRRNTAASGMGLKSWPATGEYRVRVKAAAILPPGVEEVPLRLVMGYALDENSSTLQVESVGTVRLTNRVDEPQWFEFRGRIENHPVRPGRVTPRGQGPPTMAITPQNLWDDGRLNDRLDPLAMPRAVVQTIQFEAPVTDVWPPEHHTRILFESPLRESDLPAYVDEVLRRFMSRAFRRPTLPEEVERFRKIYEIYAADSETFEEAMRETLAMVLVSPQFLYHAATPSDGTWRQYALASRLSYFLWGSLPDDELMGLAASGSLDDPEVVATQARRLLADERSHDFVRNFTTQWLSLEKSKAVKINTSLYPRFLYLVGAGERRGTEVPYRPTIRDHMHNETVAFVAELIRRNESVLKVIDSEFACLNEPLAAHYGVEGVQGHEIRPVPIRPAHRLGGLLTHGSVLIANSTGSAPHPIYRAVWLREAILGDEVKPPPAEVPALADTAGEAAEQAVSIKELLRQHRQEESCNDCHSRLDPWGIPFERYNAIGRYQPMAPAEGARVRGFNAELDKDLAGYQQYLQSVHTVPVPADAEVPRGPRIDGMAELKSHLLASRKHDIAENVLRRLLSYGLGRKLGFRDRTEVRRLMEQARRDQYQMQDMIVAICQSPLFRGAASEDR